MNDADLQRIDAFLQRWTDSSGNENANAQPFFVDLCDALGVERPPAKGSVPDDPYCFEKNLTTYSPNGTLTTKRIDFYKADHFVIEAKQGGTTSGKGTAKRGTETYRKAMLKAFVQALDYAKQLTTRPPFLLTCDIGDHFALWMGFSGEYGGYDARREFALADLRKAEVFDLFVDIFTNPQKRNPEKIAAKVTREVADDLAKLARSLETQVEPQQVAQFLMRCIFTMFAEDVELLKEPLFTQALEERWIKNPNTFKEQVERLWQAMNEGKPFGFSDRLLRFNGGLFAEAIAFDLTADQLKILLQAAKRDWKHVEPAIFGTLLERALDPKERSKLGAHYTPRSYVERLVRPVVIEPLRLQWETVQGAVNQLLANEGAEPTEKQKKAAMQELEAFLKVLREIKILDPACGSGNFLYVTLDLMKQLESEVLKRLADVQGGEQLRLDEFQINPAQFLGIEINPRAAAIADLVIWIGYLQWHFRRFGDIPPIEPVLREYHNIECRDAVLAYDGKEPEMDAATGKVRTRWGGRMMKSAVTGEEIPDPSDQVVIYRYLNPRAAEWQEADYIIGNPPFIGKRGMRNALGTDYVDALRSVHAGVPESCDYVMYWWNMAAALLENKKIGRFGFITTNSISQAFNSRLLDKYMTSKNPISLIYAVPDHPWVDSADGAAVRIAMTVASADVISGRLDILDYQDKQAEKFISKVGVIRSNLTIGANVAGAIALKANRSLCAVGFQLNGRGFVITPEEAAALGLGKREGLDRFIRPLRNGRDISQASRNLMVIDLDGLSNNEVADLYPEVYQWVYERVKPERDHNNEAYRREFWWLFGRRNTDLRNALEPLSRYIASPVTAKHRFFVFLRKEVAIDSTSVAIALSDAYFFGVLSSRIHTVWALAAGGWLGVGNDPRYQKSDCFEPFPFPDVDDIQKQKIRDLGERLDAHRKRTPEVTITSMYNLLEKLRKGEPFTDADKAFNQRALITTLKQLHDDLDDAVFDAYGWSPDLTDDQLLENLVTLNAQRAEEERNGIIRYLRPDYQAPETTQIQPTLPGITPETPAIAPTPTDPIPFPKDLKAQLATLRDHLRTHGGEWTLPQLHAQFKTATRQKRAIQDCLESLETLGILASHEDPTQTRHWYLAELQKKT